MNSRPDSTDSQYLLTPQRLLLHQFERKLSVTRKWSQVNFEIDENKESADSKWREVNKQTIHSSGEHNGRDSQSSYCMMTEVS